MNSIIKEALKIRYVKLHYTIQLLEDCQLPMNKVSALRGGIGEMLLRSNCISDRDCEKCSFESECMVQRTMYSQYTIQPKGLSVGSKDSIGYVIECEDYKTDFYAGDEIKFILPNINEKISVVVDKIINAKNSEQLPKLSAGQHNSILIPIEKIPVKYRDKFVPLILAYKHK